MWRLHFGFDVCHCLWSPIHSGRIRRGAAPSRARVRPDDGWNLHDTRRGRLSLREEALFARRPNTGLRRVLEVLAVFLVFYGVVGGRNLWYSNPIIFLVIPLWVIIAYAFVGFRQLPTKQPKP